MASAVGGCLLFMYLGFSPASDCFFLCHASFFAQVRCAFSSFHLLNSLISSFNFSLSDGATFSIFLDIFLSCLLREIFCFVALSLRNLLSFLIFDIASCFLISNSLGASPSTCFERYFRGMKTGPSFPSRNEMPMPALPEKLIILLKILPLSFSIFLNPLVLSMIGNTRDWTSGSSCVSGSDSGQESTSSI